MRKRPATRLVGVVLLLVAGYALMLAAAYLHDAGAVASGRASHGTLTVGTCDKLKSSRSANFYRCPAVFVTSDRAAAVNTTYFVHGDSSQRELPMYRGTASGAFRSGAADFVKAGLLPLVLGLLLAGVLVLVLAGTARTRTVLAAALIVAAAAGAFVQSATAEPLHRLGSGCELRGGVAPAVVCRGHAAAGSTRRTPSPTRRAA